VATTNTTQLHHFLSNLSPCLKMYNPLRSFIYLYLGFPSANHVSLCSQGGLVHSLRALCVRLCCAIGRIIMECSCVVASESGPNGHPVFDWTQERRILHSSAPGWFKSAPVRGKPNVKRGSFHSHSVATDSSHTYHHTYHQPGIQVHIK
jgi:hypothetical protein